MDRDDDRRRGLPGPALTNLDRDPRLWVMFAILITPMAGVQILCWIDDLRERLRPHR